MDRIDLLDLQRPTRPGTPRRPHLHRPGRPHQPQTRDARDPRAPAPGGLPMPAGCLGPNTKDQVRDTQRVTRSRGASHYRTRSDAVGVIIELAFRISFAWGSWYVDSTVSVGHPALAQLVQSGRVA